VTTDKRADALRDLIELRKPLAAAVTQVRMLPWDSDKALVVLTKRDVSRLLDMYLSGQLVASEVELWADALESRDDIAYEQDAEEVLRDMIFQLANPDITVQLEPERAAQWMRSLQGV